VDWIIYLWGGEKVLSGTMLPSTQGNGGLEYTGERVIPEEENLFYHLSYLTHCMEYESAGKLIEPYMTVVDCACGVGYGSNYLGKLAKKVIGIDISKDAIAYAREKYQADNLLFIIGDARQIQMENNTIDIFVAIETLEHFKYADKFVHEIYRVLKPGGSLFLSTPDGDASPNKPADEKTGDFHYCHYEKSELEHMFADKFVDLRVTRDGMNGDCYRIIARKPDKELTYARK